MLRRIAIILLVSSIILGMEAAIARPAPPDPNPAGVVGAFEIEGNRPDDTGPGDPIDWDSTGADAPPNLVNIPDTSGKSDNTFGGGSKENVPNEWSFVTGSATGKADVTGGQVSFRELGVAPNNDTFVYVNFTRATVTGDTFTNFEFNRSDQTYVNAKGTTVPFRTAGDLMIAIFVVNGGQSRTIELREWTGNNLAGSWTPIGTCSTLDCDVAVNADARGRWNFAEAAIRLTAFFQPSCPGFGKVWIKTTSSQAFESAALQDRTAQHDINLSNCGRKNWEFSFSPEPIAGASVYAVYTVAGEADPRELQLTDGDGDGTYTAADGEIPTGDVNYHFEVRNGTSLIWASDSANESFAAGETKTNTASLAYEISLTPPEAENFASEPGAPPATHDLTATVTIAGTSTGLPNVPVQLAVTSSDPSGCGTIDTTSGVTDANGTITTTLSASGACSATVTAWIDGAGGTSGTLDAGEANDASNKAFATYDVNVTPASAVNEVDQPHTFTITATKDVGGGAQALADVPVSFTLNPGTTGSTITDAAPDGSIAADGLSGTCTTDAAGQCTVTIQGSTPGSATLTASLTVTNSDGTGNFTSDGDKTYVDFRLNVTPETAANNLNVEHEFTVTLDQNDGDPNSYVGLAGETVTLTLDPGDSDAHFTTINGAPADDPVSETCVTDANGQCFVRINASEPGHVTLTASWSNQTIVVGGADESDTATKDYLAFNLDVTPDDADNEVNDEHEFTVSLTQDSGGGPDGLSGETITLTLNPGTTDAHFTTINGAAADDPVSETCVTDGNGECSVKIISSEAGHVTLTASWSNQTIVVGGASDSDTATKDYLAFNLDATPDSATNEVGDPHTFTITLTQDTGSGPQGLAGETVSLSLNPGSSDAHFTLINGAPADDPVSETCVTDPNGQCTATIVASEAGQATLTASWSNQTIVVGGASDTDTVTKDYRAFRLTAAPESAVNRVNQPHTFIVTLEQDIGSGFTGLAGETVSLTLDPGGTDAHFTFINGEAAGNPTSETCVTNVNGVCSVTIVSSQAGTATLTATWSNQTIVTGGATATDTATKTYELNPEVSVAKTSCPENTTPPNSLAEWRVTFSTNEELSNATLVDILPAGTSYISADPINGVDAVNNGQTVTWTFATLPAGSYNTVIRVSVGDVDLGTQLVNTATLDAEEIDPVSGNDTLTVSNEGAGGSARAFGVQADLLGGGILPDDPDIGPTPDTNADNDGDGTADEGDDHDVNLLSIPNPLTTEAPLATLLHEHEADNSTNAEQRHTATSTTADVNVIIPDTLKIEADAIVARSESWASATTAGSSDAGSTIVNLRINDVPYGNISEPTTVIVRNPLNEAEILGRVYLLEHVTSGAAAGDTQPDGDLFFSSGLAVNGIHVVLLEETGLATEVIVAHTDSDARFPSGLGCGATTPAVSGHASALIAYGRTGLDSSETAPGLDDTAFAEVARVDLPITGGSRDATLADVDVAPLNTTADGAFTHTEGELTDLNDDGVAPEADSRAKIAELHALDDAIEAHAVEATAHADSENLSGDTTILDLHIGDVDVCAALGMGPEDPEDPNLCNPKPNTELLAWDPNSLLVVLNEQQKGAGSITVNAVHIWVVGNDNPLGLPAGVEIIISQAHADAHPSNASTQTGDPVRVITIFSSETPPSAGNAAVAEPGVAEPRTQAPDAPEAPDRLAAPEAPQTPVDTPAVEPEVSEEPASSSSWWWSEEMEDESSSGGSLTDVVGGLF